MKSAYYANIFFLGVIFSVLIAAFAWAATESSTVGSSSTGFSFNPGFHIDAITKAFEQAVGASLQSKFWTFSKGLFGVLAIIEFAWACSELALSGLWYGAITITKAWGSVTGAIKLVGQPWLLIPQKRFSSSLWGCFTF